ncbi:MerR family transcriptional regulator [Clostridium sp.]|uniref:MerR family transcriptional regulator n=1 Tax=Clostridium sp. TaxID=1506 RepID=UPI003463A563
MNITKASRVTGLTKSQLRFYEEVELINPEKNKNNGQRDYNHEDLKTAQLVDRLNILDFSMESIKDLLNSEKRLIEVIKEKISYLEINNNDLQRIKNIINLEYLDKDKENLIENIIEIIKAIEDYKEETDKEYIKQKILKVFPGNYGKLVLFQLGHFLSTELNSEDKKTSFKKVITYLDNLNNYKIPKDMDNLLNTLDDDILLELQKEKRSTVLAVINNDLKEIEKIKTGILDFINNIGSNDKYREMYLKSKRRNKTLEDKLKEKGVYEDFKTYFKVLSDEYVPYLNSVENIERSLNISYDEDGVPCVLR